MKLEEQLRRQVGTSGCYEDFFTGAITWGTLLGELLKLRDAPLQSPRNLLLSLDQL